MKPTKAELVLIVWGAALVSTEAHAVGIIDEILDNITGRFRSVVNFVFDPLWEWYFWLAVGILGAAGIMWFFGWLKPVRIAVSIAVAGAAIYVAGGRHMHNRLKGDLEREREALREREAAAKAARNQGGGGGWFGR